MADEHAARANKAEVRRQELDRRVGRMWALFVGILFLGWAARHFVEGAPHPVRLLLLIFGGARSSASSSSSPRSEAASIRSRGSGA